MNVIDTAIADLVVIEPKVFGDERGFFLETFNAARYASLAGIQLAFVQDNHSRSAKGVLRGLHFQKSRPQGKLIHCIDGEIFDVAVDLRPGSATYGKWESIVLSSENKKQFYVPPGFAHGFQVLSETADVGYKCTDYYNPQDEGGIIWNDPDLAIPWPLANPCLSEKDKRLPFFNDLKNG